MLFHSSYTALLTPFKDNQLDINAYRNLVDFQIENGTHGLVPVGTTGESPTLSHDEHKKLVEVCVEQANGRVPVIAGAGSNSTSEAVDFVKHACAAGADGLLVVTPYYNKPTQSGLLAHYNELIKNSSKPIIIYDIPGRSVIKMSDNTMAELAKNDLIVGVKDATADLARPTRLQNLIGDDFIQLCFELDRNANCKFILHCAADDYVKCQKLIEKAEGLDISTIDPTNNLIKMYKNINV